MKTLSQYLFKKPKVRARMALPSTGPQMPHGLVHDDGNVCMMVVARYEEWLRWMKMTQSALID